MTKVLSIRKPSVLDPSVLLRRWFLVLLSLALIAFVTVIAFDRDFYTFYLERFIAPTLEQQLGFKVGKIKVTEAAGTFFPHAITEVTPGGAFANAGARPGDIPIGYVHGFYGFWQALHEARGGVARVRVIRADEHLDRTKERVLFVRIPRE